MVKTILYKGVEITVSDDDMILWNGKIRKHHLNHDGYPCVSIKIPNIGWRQIAVHRLIALAYIPNPYNLPEIDHIDFNRTNYSIGNLQWISHKCNVQRSVKNRNNISGANNPNYGNHKLSERYKKDKTLSKIKNGRIGINNGKAKAICVFFNGILLHEFPYMKPCLEWAKETLFPQYAYLESVRNRINKLIKEGKSYHGFTFVKNEGQTTIEKVTSNL